MAPEHRKDAPPDAPPQVPPSSASSPVPVSASWSRVRRALAPRATRAQVLAGLLCALLGFALVVQVQQNRTDGLAALRQDELVRILDEVTQRSEELDEEAARLRATRSELASGTDTARAAQEAARERAEVLGILAGRLPARGPGIELEVGSPEDGLSALVLFNVLEELRNAGAEAVQVDSVRITASSWFVDGSGGVVVDGVTLEPPYLWRAIGDPETLSPALNVPGGALATVRAEGGTTDLRPLDEVVVDAVVAPREPEHATPVPAGEQS